MNQQVFNFCAGPATLPQEVLKAVQQELRDWQNLGVSVMEVSHRSKPYEAMAAEAEQDLRDLMHIPDNYKVLFLQGGATAQFAMTAMNLLGKSGQADYIQTGIWATKAIKEGSRYGEVSIAGDCTENGFSRVPQQSELTLNPNADYLHYTTNETIGGLEFNYIPDAGDVPLVVDMSSNILSRPIDVSRFGVIYAGAQKNIGPAGLTIVIIRDDLMEQFLPFTPTVWQYKNHADNDSMLNTPPTFGWYLAGQVFKWLKRQGGIEAIAEINQRKAQKLYAAIDQSEFYSNPIDLMNRSWMNVPFVLADESLNAAFLEQAEARGLLNLKGHRSVGGMRASIYNAMPEAGVDTLIAFMAEFEQKNWQSQTIQTA
ncbi:3-phosphoserine/phosphohydroxythreonine transaminase [Pelagibaculum spongiae]|uniref:Phosphoserine aminotransferase n=1 Tax=Pelagibaculum spongiae TaxID=2080658 RepID=A0A2V1H5N4_9GAMM|nr:3-phosphoserine/phosphohydroxythreonine transaminase [Pelagibaculum spongiae]PVZ72568.1 3-phosphoserine/phosphohydroxythreonine transaminase [Pelagibaculum spongiae]